MNSFFKKIIVSALTIEAKLVLKKYKPKIIAVTGSVGKTSTKDAIFGIISPFLSVRKSEKSFNSEIGLPLTILGLPNAWSNPLSWTLNLIRGFFNIIFPHKYPDWLVLEIGADRPNDIKNVSEWLSPDIVVITKFAKVPVHVEFFGTPEKIIEEKSYLVKALKEDGTLILNADDQDVLALSKLARKKPLTFSLADTADIRAINYEIMYSKENLGPVPSGVHFKIEHKGNTIPISLSGVLGKSHVYPIIAGLLVGEVIGLNIVKMVDVVSSLNLPPGRMKILAGEKNTTIIDDTYNSSPVAQDEALQTLNEVKTNGRKIAVLGDMMELGKYTVDEHVKAGDFVGKFASVLFTVGIRARHIAMGALDAGMDEKNIFQFEDSKTAGKMLEQMLVEGDLILVKGSQSTRMERVVEEIMANPEDKEKLLVRQDEEWRQR